MIIKKILCLFCCFYFTIGYSFAAGSLLQSSNFTYLGAFKVPHDYLGDNTYHGLAYGGSVIAYNPAKNSLFIVGHNSGQLVAEISIPEPVKSTNLDDLNTASTLQNMADITEGNRSNLAADGSVVSTSGTRIGGLLVYDGYLYGSVYGYYDGGYSCVRSHFRSGKTLATTGDFLGMAEVGNKPSPVPQAGHIAGYMTPIPADWQTALGGKVLTGMSALSILGRTSSGSAAFAFDPDDLSTTTPAPAVALLDYPINHQTIGTYYSSQTPYNKGSHHSGVIFPEGSRSILYTGRQGLGESCYGPGTNIEEEDGNRYNYPPPNNTCMGTVMTDTNDPCCYDPVNLDKGAHAYPYGDYVWAYDAEDFARIKEGGAVVDNPSENLVDSVSPTSTETYKPWFIKPYAMWELHFPFKQTFSYVASGASAYDEATKRLYIAQGMADGTRPLIHVYSIDFFTPPPNLRILE